MIVRVVVGGYLVSPRRGGLPCFVGKDKRCTCGDEACEHVKAVACHLKQGGHRAPKCAQPVADTSACPVCGGPAEVLDAAGTRSFWRCRANSLHYWEWRGEHGGVREFLTRPHPNKRGSFYGQSRQQREKFLDTAHERLYAEGYSPF